MRPAAGKVKVSFGVSRYGITEAEWHAIFEHQGGRCAICLRMLRHRFREDMRPAKCQVANLDHSHAVEAAGDVRGSVRGLLCRWCNHDLLGRMLKDDLEKARRLVAYLESPPARAVL